MYKMQSMICNYQLDVIHRFILLQNRSGKTRLSKWYVPYDEEEKEKIKQEVHRLITTREPRFTNFVEWRTHKVCYSRCAVCLLTTFHNDPPAACLRSSIVGMLDCISPSVWTLTTTSSRIWKASISWCAVCFQRCGVCYLRNILSYSPNFLQVEVFDHFFGNVCELDLVFNFHKVYMIIDELFLAGEVQETSKPVILHRVQLVEKLD